MEKTSDKNVISFKDLIYEDVVTEYHNAGGYTTVVLKEFCRFRNINGDLKSGEMTLLSPKSLESRNAFINVITGRIPETSKTYGEVLYNDKERTWDEWNKILRYLDLNIPIDDIKDYLNKECCLLNSEITKEEVDQVYTDVSDKIEAILFKKLGKNKFSKMEKQLSVIIAQTVLAPEILILDNFNFPSEITNDFLPFLKEFARENNAIVILAPDKASGKFNYVYDGFLNHFDIIMYLKPDRLNFYKNGELITGQFKNDSSEKKLTQNVNDIDVCLDNISVRNIWSFCKKRVLSSMPMSYLFYFSGVTIFLSTLIYYFGKKFLVKTPDNINLSSYTEPDLFYVSLLCHMNMFWYITPILGLLYSSEYFSPKIHITEDLIRKDISPYDYLFARVLTFNYPGYFASMIAIFIAWCLFYKQYLSIYLMGSIMLFQRIFLFIFNLYFLLFVELRKNDKFLMIFVAFVSVLTLLDYLTKNANLGIGSVSLINCFLTYLSPATVLSNIIEVLLLKKAASSDRSSVLFRMYCITRKKQLEKLHELYGGYNREFSIAGLFANENFKPSDLFLLKGLVDNTAINICLFFLSLTFLILLILVIGRKLIAPNIRLKLNN